MCNHASGMTLNGAAPTGVRVGGEIGLDHPGHPVGLKTAVSSQNQIGTAEALR
jgi:hypothetical protein